MNRLVHVTAAGALLAFGAAAQDEMMRKMKAEAEAKATVMMKTVGAVRGQTVKGAPYSADEVNETNQMLADGTRIHREVKTSVYRDSEGRTRRETPDNITITDPVANVTYLLDPKSMTGQKLTMATGNFMFLRTPGPDVAVSGNGASSTFSIHTDGDGPATITVNGMPMDEKAVAETMAKAKASGSPQIITYDRHEVITTSGSGGGVGIGSGTSSASASAGGGGGAGYRVRSDTMAAPTRVMMKRNAGESLGKQMVEGVNADGMRDVTTIPVGSIGNDRPIQITNESWYSEELQMMVSSKRSDPRTGDETFRLTNISRSEPAAFLFQAPSGYQITERK
jgi:hypothetical protein